MDLSTWLTEGPRKNAPRPDWIEKMKKTVDDVERATENQDETTNTYQIHQNLDTMDEIKNHASSIELGQKHYKVMKYATKPKVSKNALTAVKNMGNTCYMNAVIFYSLRFVPMFTKEIHRFFEPDLQETVKFYAHLPEFNMLRLLNISYQLMTAMEVKTLKLERAHLTPLNKPFEPNAFIGYLGKLIPEYVPGQPQDADELLFWFLEWLQKCFDLLEERG